MSKALILQSEVNVFFVQNIVNFIPQEDRKRGLFLNSLNWMAGLTFNVAVYTEEVVKRAVQIFKRWKFENSYEDYWGFSMFAVKRKMLKCKTDDLKKTLF